MGIRVDTMMERVREEVTQIDIKTPYAGRKAGEKRAKKKPRKHVGSRQAELYGLRRRTYFFCSLDSVLS
jgi:hypothetical protein